MLSAFVPERFSLHALHALTLVYYDGPVVLLLRDNAGTPHLTLLTERTDEGDTWLSVPLREDDAARLASAERPVGLAAACTRSGGPVWVYSLGWSAAGRATGHERAQNRSEVPSGWWPQDVLPS